MITTKAVFENSYTINNRSCLEFRLANTHELILIITSRIPKELTHIGQEVKLQVIKSNTAGRYEKTYKILKVEPYEKDKYVLLRGIKHGNKFITTVIKDKDQTKLIDGTTAYEILGYVGSISEGQIKLDGRSFPIS